jgi:carbamoyl-phosphate synthase large subunit
MKDLNVLVLGVGGNVSQGILKALALSSLKCRVVGACITPEAFGLHTVDRSYVSPPATDPKFVDWLFEVSHKEQIDAVLSGVEPVLAVASSHREALRADTGAVVIVSDSKRLEIGADKLFTARWLEQNQLNYPLSEDVSDQKAVTQLVERVGFPLVAKPRSGKGSRGIVILRNQENLEFASRQQGYVIQEYLGDEESEYTAGCFSDSAGEVRGVMVMRRYLEHGTTVRAEAGSFPEVREEAQRIARALQPYGPCNVQMRIANGRPVCFEINVRFSGTTPIRVRLGFNEVEAALKHYVLGEKAVDLPVVTEGIAVRYWNEAYLTTAMVDRLRNSSTSSSDLGKCQIENYGINLCE